MEKKSYEDHVNDCIQSEMETLYPKETETTNANYSTSHSLENLKKELESANKTIEDLKIEENIFNGISSMLYAREREVDNLTWLLMESEKTISEIIKNNKENQDKLEKLLAEFKIYTSR